MLYVIYNKKTTDILRATGRSVGCFVYNYKTESAAKAALTRLDKKGKLGMLKVWNEKTRDYDVTNYVKDDFAITDTETFRNETEVMVERVNIMTGKKFMEPKNTPNSCSPASEQYWSM